MSGHEKQPATYILSSGRYGTLYIGVSSNLIGRLWQHRAHALQSFTSRYAVERLVHYELFADMWSAIAREKQLKNWRRQWKINLIEGGNPDWRDLAVGLGLPPLVPPSGHDGC